MRISLIVAALLAGTGVAVAQSGDAPQGTPPAVEQMEGFTEVSFDDLSPDELIDAMLYGADGNEIGQVTSVIPADAAVGDVIVDVGDLVGLAETPLAFQPVDMIALRSDEEELRLISRMTRDDVAAVAATSAN